MLSPMVAVASMNASAEVRHAVHEAHARNVMGHVVLGVLGAGRCRSVVREHTVQGSDERCLLTAGPVIGHAIGNGLHRVCTSEVCRQVHRAPGVVPRQADLDFGSSADLVRGAVDGRIVGRHVVGVVVEILEGRFVEGDTATSQDAVETVIQDDRAGADQTGLFLGHLLDVRREDLGDDDISNASYTGSHRNSPLQRFGSSLLDSNPAPHGLAFDRLSMAHATLIAM
jgi:hypothetical protein